jgi:hypothetical protein
MSTGDAAPSREELKAAMKAFKKRLKLTRLDDDSKIAGGPLSKGKGAEIVAISPPNHIPQAIWDELVKKGKLRKVGDGLYEQVPE